MQKAVFLDVDSIDTGDLDLSSINSSLDNWQFCPSTQASDVKQAIAGATIVVTNKVVLDADVIQNSPSLKLICVSATGTNNVDLNAAKMHDVLVCNVRDYATPSVTQHVFTLILALMTNLKRYEQAVVKGDWSNSQQFCLLDYPISELSGKTLGIVGYGVLGKSVAKIAQAFGMRVCLHTRTKSKTEFPYLTLSQLLKSSDVVSLHCPLTEQTRNMIGAEEFALMKPHSILINAARGGIVNEQALADALVNAMIGGAGVDVLSVEPPGIDNPLMNPQIPNLIVTPHIAWASRESRQRCLEEVAKNIRAYQAGKPRNLV